MATTCPHCDGARRITGRIAPDKSSRCPRCHGTGKDAPTLGDLADMAAGELPHGWQIRLCVEKESGWVELDGPRVDMIDYPSNHESVEESFADALEFAVETGRRLS